MPNVASKMGNSRKAAPRVALLALEGRNRDWELPAKSFVAREHRALCIAFQLDLAKNAAGLSGQQRTGRLPHLGF